MMKTNILDENPAAVLRLSEAILQIWNKRGDFVSMLMGSHRQIAGKQSGVDPDVSASDFYNALSGVQVAPLSEEQQAARADLVQAALAIWYKLPDDLKSSVMTQVREIAIEQDEDPVMAMIATDQILDAAKGAGDALAEQYGAAKAEQEIRAQKRDERERQRVLARFER